MLCLSLSLGIFNTRPRIALCPNRRCSFRFLTNGRLNFPVQKRGRFSGRKGQLAVFLELIRRSIAALQCTWKCFIAGEIKDGGLGSMSTARSSQYDEKNIWRDAPPKKRPADELLRAKSAFLGRRCFNLRLFVSCDGSRVRAGRCALARILALFRAFVELFAKP